MQGTVVFGPGEEVQEIVVKIVDDDMSEPDVHFSINLTAACIDGGGDVTIMRKTTLVTIVDDDDGGVLVFELPTFEVSALRIQIFKLSNMLPCIHVYSD